MTDDVMSDCVGGDYVIEKLQKNDEIGGPFYRKGMTSGTPLKASNITLGCLVCAIEIFWRSYPP